MAGGHQEVDLRAVSAACDEPLVREFYDGVLVPSFPPDELGEPWWIDCRGDAEKGSRTILAIGKHRSVLGGIVGELFSGSGVLLISWLAVRPDTRGQQIGTRLMERAAAEWYGQPSCQLVVGEIDDPRYWPSTRQDPVDRLRFYDRFGVRALCRPYFQPSVGPGFAPVPHMLLACFDPAAPAVRSPDVVDGQVVRSFIEEYLRSSAVLCGRVGPNVEDRWLLGFYDGSDIPLVPLLEYERIPDPDPPGLGSRES